MEQDLERGDKAAPGMSLLGLRMLVTAHRASHCQHCVQDHLTQQLSLMVAMRRRENKDVALQQLSSLRFFSF